MHGRRAYRDIYPEIPADLDEALRRQDARWQSLNARVAELAAAASPIGIDKLGGRAYGGLWWCLLCLPRPPATRATGAPAFPPRSSTTPSGCTSGSTSATGISRACWPSAASWSAARPSGSGAGRSDHPSPRACPWPACAGRCSVETPPRRCGCARARRDARDSGGAGARHACALQTPPSGIVRVACACSRSRVLLCVLWVSRPAPPRPRPGVARPCARENGGRGRSLWSGRGTASVGPPCSRAGLAQ